MFKHSGDIVQIGAELGGKTQAGDGNIRINFSAEKDKAILSEVEAGCAGRHADLFLRRQALLLSKSPGFDTLLSLSAVRDVKPLD